MSSGPTFVLLDDAASGRARLYDDAHERLACRRGDDPRALLADASAALDAGRHLVLLLGYEYGAALQGLPIARDADAGREAEALAEILVFDRVRELDAAALADWFATHGDEAPCGLVDLAPHLTPEDYARAFGQLRESIAAGEIYQANFTLRLRGAAYGHPVSLYRRLRERQPVAYGALAALGDGRWVLSHTPELFVRGRDGELEARPMKGTAPIDADPAALAADPKNRAENLMIVDLLRNDLGRVAETGSVTVPALFEVEAHRTLWQMTSTVRARLRAGAGLADLVDALFPCGSITGAPKRRAMQRLAALETAPRRLYTGAIGWVAPRAGGGLGDFCLSVAIRTLLIDADRRAELGVGAGIVHDSDCHDEWQETLLKARFATGLPPAFGVFETMRVEAGAIARRDAHLARLAASARALGIAFDAAAVDRALDRARAQIGTEPAHAVWRLRLDLAPDGAASARVAPLAPLATGPVRLCWARTAVDSRDPLLRHKTTHRAVYDAAWRDAETRGAFDALFVNERGEVTEGGRSNLFIRLDEQWLTPPLACGLLPGVMRAALLRELGAREAVFGPDAVARAQRVLVCNALRGALDVAGVDGEAPTAID